MNNTLTEGAGLNGLAFIGGEGPDAKTCAELALGAGLIAAADAGLILAHNAGIRPAIIAGDMDSIDNLEILKGYNSGCIITYPHDKDLTDTEIVINLLLEKGCTAITIAGGGGGRMDHIFALRDVFEREKKITRWVTASEDIYKVCGNFTASVQSGATVSVFPCGDPPWKAASKGLKWPLDNVAWKRNFFGISNTALSDEISIIAEKGAFIVIFEKI
ncbi:thiamine pyrophosphokinase [Spirochaetia bacterium]|nr:thiamine pyrophosphokinase [Spirochaetia bacterium]